MSEPVDSLQSSDSVGHALGERDRFFTVQKGKGEVWTDGRKTSLEADFRILVAADGQPEARLSAETRSKWTRSATRPGGPAAPGERPRPRRTAGVSHRRQQPRRAAGPRRFPRIGAALTTAARSLESPATGD